MTFRPFEDADRFPDELWFLVEREEPHSNPEKHFARVMRLHGEFLNGGLNQVMYNVKEVFGHDIADYVSSYAEVGLMPFATVIALADQEIAVGEGWQSVFDREEADLDDVYLAMTYGFPSTDRKRFREFLSFDSGGLPQDSDWVARAILKYARDNIGEFGNFIRLWQQSRN